MPKLNPIEAGLIYEDLFFGEIFMVLQIRPADSATLESEDCINTVSALILFGGDKDRNGSSFSGLRMGKVARFNPHIIQNPKYTKCLG